MRGNVKEPLFLGPQRNRKKKRHKNDNEKHSTDTPGGRRRTPLRYTSQGVAARQEAAPFANRRACRCQHGTLPKNQRRPLLYDNLDPLAKKPLPRSSRATLRVTKGDSRKGVNRGV